jgi:uracil-DNA glycosylase family 4
MTDQDIKLLKLLDSQVQSCELCNLFKNGRAKPHWTNASRYGIFLEAPGKEEVLQNTPVVGTAGKKLWQILHEAGFERSDFLIVNSVNCRPLVGNKNGKPTADEMKSCSDWVRKYIRIVKPYKMLIMGSYAINSFNKIMGGEILPTGSMVDNNGKTVFLKIFDIAVHLVVSVHPSYSLYNPVIGKQLLEQSINIFKGI